jgi:hypothetical protein
MPLAGPRYSTEVPLREVKDILSNTRVVGLAVHFPGLAVGNTVSDYTLGMRLVTRIALEGILGCAEAYLDVWAERSTKIV